MVNTILSHNGKSKNQTAVIKNAINNIFYFLLTIQIAIKSKISTTPSIMLTIIIAGIITFYLFFFSPVILALLIYLSKTLYE